MDFSKIEMATIFRKKPKSLILLTKKLQMAIVFVDYWLGYMFTV